MSGDDHVGKANVLTTALDRTGDGFVTVDSALRYTYLTENAADILGIEREAILGDDLWAPLSSATRAAGEEHVERALTTGTKQSFQLDAPDGGSYLVRVYPDESGLSLLFLEVAEPTQYEQNLGRLHEATRQMLLMETPAAIADLISSAAVRILDLPVNAVHFYDEETETLVPVAQSEACHELLGTPPALDAGLAWEAYRAGQDRVCPDLDAEEGVFNESTVFRSELLLPLGEHGVFIVASTEPAEFAETDVTLAKLLTANATVALDQVTTESRLAQQRDNLELLTRMMSHDIRNDLQVVGAMAELLGETLDGTEREYVERIRRNTAEAVELTTSAKELTEAMLRSDASGHPVQLREILGEEIDDVEANYPDATITVDGAIPAVSVLGDEMLDSVFRNVLKNAIQHNDTDQPEVTVSVDVTAETVSVRIADNGPGVPDERKDDIFGRGERGMESHGTGIGLYLVQTLTEQYGGCVRVEDNDPRGAVFVVELERA